MKYLDFIELQQKWRKSGDPQFVWEAYSLAREAGCPLPEWVMVEMDKFAAAVLRPPAPTRKPQNPVRPALTVVPPSKYFGPRNVYARAPVQRQMDALGRIASRLADARRALNDVVIEVSIENATDEAELNKDYRPALMRGKQILPSSLPGIK
ncbi:MAG: hypothetical protein PVF63_07530 [Gammaproteobacteria bacterium]|jgi:hypothetical protein